MKLIPVLPDKPSTLTGQTLGANGITAAPARRRCPEHVRHSLAGILPADPPAGTGRQQSAARGP